MKILHNKYNKYELTTDDVLRVHKMLETAVGDEYKILTTPTDLTLVDGDDVLIVIDTKNYTYNEIIQLINNYKK